MTAHSKIPHFRCFAVVFLSLCTAAMAASAQDAGYAPGIVLVKFKSNADSALVNRLVARHNLKLQRVLKFVNVRRFTLPSGQDPRVMAALLSKYDLVEFAEPDYVRQARLIPNDPLFTDQWDMTRMRLPTAWDYGRGSASVVVAVLDTGIDLTHPDLVGSLWRNTGEIADNNIDDDRNGYVDDVNGYDFAGDGVFPLVGAEDPVPNDTVGHGTHVSGTIAAQQGNGIGISGVAPLCKIMAVKVLGGVLGSGYSSDIVDGITYAVNNGAKVINMSLGGTYMSLAEYNGTKYAWDHNVLIFAAAGNAGDQGNPIEYPAAYPFTVSVGATDSADGITYFSTYNAYVELCAPGYEIMSTVPGGYEQAGWSGTSMATPHATGLAALLVSKFPGIGAWEVRSMLQQSGIDRGMAGWDIHYGWGRIDADNARKLARLDAKVERILTPAPASVYPKGSLFAAVWTPVAGAKNYRMKVTLPNATVRTAITDQTSLTVNPNAVMATGFYTFAVDALQTNGTVISSASVAFTKTN